MTPQLLKAARAGLNLTQSELAAAAKVHPKSIAYWEGSKRPTMPDRANGIAPKITDALAALGVAVTDNGLTFTK